MPIPAHWVLSTPCQVAGAKHSAPKSVPCALGTEYSVLPPPPRDWEASEETRGSLPLLAALLGGGRVVAADQLLVLRHEALAAVGVHLGPHGLGQVAPDVLVEVGDLVGVLAAGVAAAAGVVAAHVGRLLLLALALLAALVAAGHLLPPAALAALPPAAGLLLALALALAHAHLAALLPLAAGLLLLLLAAATAAALRLLVLLASLRRLLGQLDEFVQVLHDVVLHLPRPLAKLLVRQAVLRQSHVLADAVEDLLLVLLRHVAVVGQVVVLLHVVLPGVVLLRVVLFRVILGRIALLPLDGGQLLVLGRVGGRPLLPLELHRRLGQVVAARLLGEAPARQRADGGTQHNGDSARHGLPPSSAGRGRSSSHSGTSCWSRWRAFSSAFARSSILSLSGCWRVNSSVRWLISACMARSSFSWARGGMPSPPPPPPPPPPPSPPPGCWPSCFFFWARSGAPGSSFSASSNWSSRRSASFCNRAASAPAGVSALPPSLTCWRCSMIFSAAPFIASADFFIVLAKIGAPLSFSSAREAVSPARPVSPCASANRPRLMSRPRHCFCRSSSSWMRSRSAMKPSCRSLMRLMRSATFASCSRASSSSVSSRARSSSRWASSSRSRASSCCSSPAWPWSICSPARFISSAAWSSVC